MATHSSPSASSRFFGSKKPITGLDSLVRVKNRGVLFHRIRDFKQYHFDGVPPASQVQQCELVVHPRLVGRLALRDDADARVGLLLYHYSISMHYYDY